MKKLFLGCFAVCAMFLAGSVQIQAQDLIDWGWSIKTDMNVKDAVNNNIVANKVSAQDVKTDAQPANTSTTVANKSEAMFKAQTAIKPTSKAAVLNLKNANLKNLTK